MTLRNGDNVMKILGVYTFSKGEEVGPVDRWRVQHPLQELAKHDHEVDLKNTFLSGDGKSMSQDDLHATIRTLSSYDLVVSSYFSNKMTFALLGMLQEKGQIRAIIDVDDNFFDVPKHNTFWLSVNDELVEGMKLMIQNQPHVSTTNKTLADFLRDKRKTYGHSDESVLVLPNLISLKKHQHKTFDNGDIVKIGYFGGSSHYKDMNDTGFNIALSRIMHKYKHVHFEHYGWWGENKRKREVVGTYVDANLPKQRIKLHKGARGEQWYELYKTINLDIACGPLEDTFFNACKSPIKWMESSLANSAFIASDVGPYKETIKHGEDGLLVQNTVNDWYDALEELVIKKTYRKRLAANAKRRVKADHSLENNWQQYERVYQKICVS